MTHLRWRGPALLVFALLLTACGGQQVIEVGADAPAFDLPAADGTQVSLTDYEGRPFLLFFHMAMG
jgi:cytochrome oxidase Cu insertion factor (SCO1/SenC/PrrC family)